MRTKKSSPAPRKDQNLVGKFKQVRVVFVGASFLLPKAEPRSQIVDDNFGIFILDELFRRQSILSKLRGVLKKTHHCRECDSDLMGLKAHRRRFSLEISYKKLPSFKLEIEMPAIPCRKCGANNAVNEQTTEYIVAGAIAEAFRSIKKT
jgi:hypothetical protein